MNKQFLKMSLVQKSDFIKTQEQDLWAERAVLGLRRVTDYISSSWERVRDKISL